MTTIGRNYPTRLTPFSSPQQSESSGTSATSGVPTTSVQNSIKRLPSFQDTGLVPVPVRAVSSHTVHREPPAASKNDGYIKFFRHYGVQLHLDNKQLRGSCPFPDCHKDEHFYANYGTGQWDCKRCTRSGNAYTFISLFHQACLDMTTDADYIALAETRQGIPAWVFKEWQLAVNSATGEWMLPAWSLEKKITNLYIYRQLWDANKQEHIMRVMSGPTLKQTLYGLQRFKTGKDRPLYILEGHWDTLAFEGLAAHVIEPKLGIALCDCVDFLGAPGAGTFPKEYLHLLDGRDVRLLNDNDEAGRKGVETLIKAIAQNNTIPARFGVLTWPEGMKPGYDIRDLIYQGV